MKLRNNKLIGIEDTILNKCINILPVEMLRIIADFHNCEYCINNDYIHCTFCGECVEKYKYHIVCQKCNICYPSKKSVIFANRRYDFVIDKHIHCDICDTVKKYSMNNYTYYCDYCSNTFI